MQQSTTTPQATGIEAQVCTDIARRQAIGIAKYGTTVADNPLNLRDWLQHAYEETLDKAVYLKRAIAEIEAKTWFLLKHPHQPSLYVRTRGKALYWTHHAEDAERFFSQEEVSQFLEHKARHWIGLPTEPLLVVPREAVLGDQAASTNAN